ncbi:MAG: hypothetical protein GY875_18025 [Gammaproteobacteria bacterium]|nr:hypothetical protein [Gammaproteobacteria bacterium]
MDSVTQIALGAAVGESVLGRKIGNKALLWGAIAALLLTRNSDRGHLLNRYGLIVSTVYLSWTVVAKFAVDQRFESELQAQNIRYGKVFTTPAPFNSLLWRAVVMDPGGYYEAYYSLMDGRGEIRFNHYPSDESLLVGIENSWSVQRLLWFSRGIYSVSLRQQDIVISDLRMGVEPHYTFNFKVGELENPHAKAVLPELLPAMRDFSQLPVLWRRIWDDSVALGPGEDNGGS